MRSRSLLRYIPEPFRRDCTASRLTHPIVMKRQRDYASEESFLDKSSRMRLVKNVVTVKQALCAVPEVLECLTDIQKSSILLAIVESLRDAEISKIRTEILQVCFRWCLALHIRLHS